MNHPFTVPGVLLALVLCVAPAVAKADACAEFVIQAPTATPAPQIPYAKGKLWKIEGKDIPGAYLFGTIHLEDTQITTLPRAVSEALGQADRFAMEVDMHPAALGEYARATVLSEGSLDKLLNADFYARLQTITEREYDLPPQVLARLKPWAVFTLLSRPRPTIGRVLDDVLKDLALEQDIPVIGLETVTELIAVLDSIPLENQLTIVKDTVCNYEMITHQIEQLTRLYLDGDLAGMMALSTRWNDRERLFEDFMERIVYGRNERMIERMLPHMRADRLFVAVGALHLTGEKGLLQSLEKMGYKITVVY